MASRSLASEAFAGARSLLSDQEHVRHASPALPEDLRAAALHALEWLKKSQPAEGSLGPEKRAANAARLLEELDAEEEQQRATQKKKQAKKRSKKKRQKKKAKEKKAQQEKERARLKEYYRDQAFQPKKEEDEEPKEVKNFI